MRTTVGGRRSKFLVKVHMGRHFTLAPGQRSRVRREMSGEGSLESFTWPMPGPYSTWKFLWAPALEYKEAKSAGRPAEDRGGGVGG